MDENREFHIFENYTKSVCRKIMSQQKKNEVKEELYSHLFEQYDRNIALGMDDEAAQTKAIEKMGDKEKIADEFGALYSIYPPAYMRSSLNFIIGGILLSYFQINLFVGFGEITKFIGKLLLIYGLFKLRSSEKKLNKALWLLIVVNIIGIIIDALVLYTVNYTDIQLIGALIILPLDILNYWWIFSGINNLCKSNITENSKKPHLMVGFIFYILCVVIILFSVFAEVSEFALISLIPMTICLCQLGRAKKVLANAETEFNLKQTLQKSEKAVFAVLAVVLAIMPVMAMLAAANPNVDAKVHNTADITIAKSEIDSAKNNMLELGFPEEYLRDLPDSEILKYSDATYLQCEEKEFLHNMVYNYKTNEKERAELSFTVDVFRFFFADGEIRIMMRLEIFDEEIANYRNGLYLQFYENDFVPAYDDNETGDYGQFFLALSEKDGKTLSTELLSEYTPKNQLEKLYISGCEFTFVDGGTNRRVYLAHSAKIASPSTIRNTCTDAVFLWQEIPISAENTSINDKAVSEFDGVMRFGNSLDSVRRFDLYDAFSFEPSYLIKTELIDWDEYEN